MSVAELEPPEDDDEDDVLGQNPAEITPAHRRTPVETRALATQLWEEYAAGMKQADIARLHGLTPFQVSYYLRKFARRYGRREIERARRMDLDRIEALIDSAWEKTLDTNDPARIKTMLMMIKLRADILGYAAPKKIEHSGETKVGVSPELADLLRLRQAENEAVRGDLARSSAGELESETVDAELVVDTDVADD